MKQHKMFCIDADLNAKLAPVNASALVNTLLRRYFDETDLNQMNPAQIQKELKAIEIREKAESEVSKL